LADRAGITEQREVREFVLIEERLRGKRKFLARAAEFDVQPPGDFFRSGEEDAAQVAENVFLRPIRMLAAQAGALSLPGCLVKFPRDLQSTAGTHRPEDFVLCLIGMTHMV
jgi:hypothetical protein